MKSYDQEWQETRCLYLMPKTAQQAQSLVSVSNSFRMSRDSVLCEVIVDGERSMLSCATAKLLGST